MKNRPIAMILALLILGATAAHAGAWVEAEGAVYQKSTLVSMSAYQCGAFICTTVTVQNFLKIRRDNGSKVNCDCEWSPVIQEACAGAQIGDNAYGLCRLDGGARSWTELVITHQAP